MKTIFQMIETYFMVLVHPFRIHQQFRFNLPLPLSGSFKFQPLNLAESLGISWIFAVIRGLLKLVLLNYFFQAFLEMQSEHFPFLQDFFEGSGSSTYYFFLFSAGLDIVFFPIGALIITEFWAWVIRKFSAWLNPALPHEEIADQVTIHALSSNVFMIIPFVGDLIQTLIYYFLLYAGLRSNLGASRSLSLVILLTPSLILGVLVAFLVFTVFYLTL